MKNLSHVGRIGRDVRTVRGVRRGALPRRLRLGAPGAETPYRKKTLANIGFRPPVHRQLAGLEERFARNLNP